MLLFYAPQVLDSEAPDLVRANMPVEWAVPAFDVLQLEDYDFVIAGDPGSSARAFDTVIARLGCPPDDQHYFSGFVLNGVDRALWRLLDPAADAGMRRAGAGQLCWAV